MNTRTAIIAAALVLAAPAAAHASSDSVPPDDTVPDTEQPTTTVPATTVAPTTTEAPTTTVAETTTTTVDPDQDVRLFVQASCDRVRANVLSTHPLGRAHTIVITVDGVPIEYPASWPTGNIVRLIDPAVAHSFTVTFDGAHVASGNLPICPQNVGATTTPPVATLPPATTPPVAPTTPAVVASVAPPTVAPAAVSAPSVAPQGLPVTGSNGTLAWGVALPAALAGLAFVLLARRPRTRS